MFLLHRQFFVVKLIWYNNYVVGRNLEIVMYVIRELPENPWAVIAKDPNGQAPTFMKSYREIEIRVPCVTRIVASVGDTGGRYVISCKGVIEEHPTDSLRCIVRGIGLPARWA